MYAIIRTGGKQYRVSEGDVLEVEKLNVQEGDEVVFDDVLTVVSDGDVKVGKPTVEGAKVTAKVAAQGKLIRSLFSNTKQRATIANARVIVSPSPALKLLLSKHKP